MRISPFKLNNLLGTNHYQPNRSRPTVMIHAPSMDNGPSTEGIRPVNITTSVTEATRYLNSKANKICKPPYKQFLYSPT